MNTRTVGRLSLLALFALALPLACVVPPTDEAAGGDEGSGAGPTTTEQPGPAGGGAPTPPSGGSDSTPPGEPTCPYEGPPPIDPSTLPPCPSCSGGAHCLPKAVIPADVAGALADCDATNKCVPDTFIEHNGLFIPESCKSVVGAEGRCLSTCLPDIAPQADKLPKSTCHDNQVCVPCYDPFTGEDTGACALSCDPGPTELPTVLPKCCFGMGTCVPGAMVPDAKLGFLKQDQCPKGEDGLVCAPDAFLSNPGYTPAPCETGWLSTLLGSKYKPGVCLPRCLAGPDSSLLSQDGCPDFHNCTPCLDPTSGKPSGACEL